MKSISASIVILAGALCMAFGANTNVFVIIAGTVLAVIGLIVWLLVSLEPHREA